MAQATRTAETITTYLSSVIDATSVLYEKKLYGHLLTVVFATIDTLGLLDAPPTQTSATGDGFKRWVNAYLLGKPLGSVTAVDLWGARCAVLHSHSSKSDSSRSGKARQIQYFGGDKNSAAARKFVRITNSMEGGIHVAMHFEDFYLAFIRAIANFAPQLEAKCETDNRYVTRLRDVLQVHPMDGVL